MNAGCIFQTLASDCDDLSLSVDSASQLVSLGDRYVEGGSRAHCPGLVQETGFNAYIGVSCIDSEGQSSGIVGMIHTRPFPHEGALLLLKTLADRLNAERERRKMQSHLLRKRASAEDSTMPISAPGIGILLPEVYIGLSGFLSCLVTLMVGSKPPMISSMPSTQTIANVSRQPSMQQSSRMFPYEIEHRVIWLDGTVKWVLERGSVIRDNQGHAIQMLGAVRDINTRKIIEMSLQERASAVPRTTTRQLGWWNFDSKTGELHCSKEYLKLLGLPPNRPILSYADYLSFIHPMIKRLRSFR